MRATRTLFSGLFALCVASTAAASTLFMTDFQNGKADPWLQTAAPGNVALDVHDGRVTLRLDGHAQVVTHVTVDAPLSANIQGFMRGRDLAAQDQCTFEYSTDAKHSWHPVVELAGAAGNLAYLHSGRVAGVAVTADQGLWLRLRADLGQPGGACWGDDLSVDRPPSAAFAPAGTREQLRAQELLDATVRDFVSMQAFTPAANAVAPSRRIEGTISLGRRGGGAFRVMRNEPFDIPLTDTIKGLPPFDFQFVSDGGQLIPVRRGPIASLHPDWEWVLEPGHLWNEPGDGGLTRAALPFSLQERNSNCLHNGVLTFLIGPNERISNVYYQISGETCAYFKFDVWGLVQARYRSGKVTNGAAVISAYRDEVDARLPVRPLGVLAQTHPGISASDFALAPAGDGDVPTLYGVIVDGVNYTGSCATRAGEYPYCDVLDLPSYSTAKTIVGAVGLMRLEQLWPGARHALIADYVPECRTRDWEGVTFENALDMVTGNFDDAGFEVDEMADKVNPFYVHERHADRIRFACTAYHRKAPPAKQWVYRSTDTYVLGTAMQAFVRTHADRKADLFDTYERDALWRPLGLSPLMMQTRRTYDSIRQPFTAYGLTYHRDDIARIALFLNDSGGMLGGVQLLDRSMLEAALHRVPAQPGWPAGYPGFTYLHSLWSRDLAPLLGCTAATWAPFLSGYGGNSVVLFPNGVIYYYYSDSWVWDWAPAAVAVNKIKPVCR